MSGTKTDKAKIKGLIPQINKLLEMNFEETCRVYDGEGKETIARVVAQGLRGHVSAGNFALKAAKMGSRQNIIALNEPKRKKSITTA